MSDSAVEGRLMEVRCLAEGYLGSLLERADKAGVKTEVEALLDKLGKGQTVLIKDVPRALRSPFPNKVLFWAGGNRMAFQSVPVKEAWDELQGKARG